MEREFLDESKPKSTGLRFLDRYIEKKNMEASDAATKLLDVLKNGGNKDLEYIIYL